MPDTQDLSQPLLAQTAHTESPRTTGRETRWDKPRKSGATPPEAKASPSTPAAGAPPSLAQFNSRASSVVRGKSTKSLNARIVDGTYFEAGGEQGSLDLVATAATFLGGYMLSNALGAYDSTEYLFSWCGGAQRVVTVVCASLDLLSVFTIILCRLFAHEIVHGIVVKYYSVPAPAAGGASASAEELKQKASQVANEVVEAAVRANAAEGELRDAKNHRAQFLSDTKWVRELAVRLFLLSVPFAFLSVALRQLVATVDPEAALFNFVVLICSSALVVYVFWRLHRYKNDVIARFRRGRPENRRVDEELLAAVA